MRQLERDSGPFLSDGPVRVIVRPTSGTETLQKSPMSLDIRTGDLSDPKFLHNAMEDVDVVLHIAGIHWSRQVVQAALDAGCQWLILVHTTGIFSKYKQASADYLETERWIESATRGSTMAVTILRPTMIYGTLDDANISRFIRMVDSLPVIPVVSGGEYTLRPVHCQDLGVAYHQVLMTESTRGKTYVLSGGTEVTLRSMMVRIARNLRLVRPVVSVPFGLAYGLAWLAYIVSIKRIDFRERVQRLCEDRSYPHDEATTDFGYSPRDFLRGLKDECYLYAHGQGKG